MPRKLSRKARSECLLKAFLSARKARTNRARQQILCEKRNLRRDGLRHVDLRLRGGELNAERSQRTA